MIELRRLNIFSEEKTMSTAVRIAFAITKSYISKEQIAFIGEVAFETVDVKQNWKDVEITKWLNQNNVKMYSIYLINNPNVVCNVLLSDDELTKLLKAINH